MAGDGLRVFHGEFLILPAPLELSGTYCSHMCPYCFANGAKPQRQLDLKNVMALINNHQSRTGLDAKLLQLKYPVNISNHVDPFSLSNYKSHVPIMRLLTEMGIPVYIQTRGGHEQAISETLDFLPPSVFYISITHQDDESRKWVEPNAPSIDHRFELIAELKRRGHEVLVGLNPLVPEWVPDPLPMLEKLKEMEVHGAWVETLHLNYKQRDGLKEWQKKRLGEDLIKKAMKLNTCKEHHDHFLLTRTLADEIGFDVYTSGQPGYSRFFEVFHQTYPATFPVVQDFINYCIETGKTLITWEDWYGFFSPRLPKLGKTNGHSDYVRQAVYLELSKHFKNLTRKTKFSYSSVLQVSYRYKELGKLPFSPWAQSAMSPVRQNGRIVYQDEAGNLSYDVKQGFPIFYFDPSGQTDGVELGQESI